MGYAIETFYEEVYNISLLGGVSFQIPPIGSEINLLETALNNYLNNLYPTTTPPFNYLYVSSDISNPNQYVLNFIDSYYGNGGLFINQPLDLSGSGFFEGAEGITFSWEKIRQVNSQCINTKEDYEVLNGLFMGNHEANEIHSLRNLKHSKIINKF
ncbi:TPA_asm: hypothetical protein [Altiarchaeum virus]|nr:MAG: hypothetical protein BWK75_06360 [Candidatus Altiarchaeales archaeon A3]DAZ85565.1 TPA_asm: hypothetical protein [Altiarchaeum virus]